MKIIIVDEKDQVIGHVERSKVDYKNSFFRVSALWVHDGNGRVLLAKRSSRKEKDPGVWCPIVSGTVDFGETYDINIIKEAKEEIGLDLDIKKLSKKTKIKVIIGNYNFFLQVYMTKFDKNYIDKLALDPREIEGVKWFDETALIKNVARNPNEYVPSFPQIIKEIYG